MKIIRLTPACKDYPWGGALLREKYGVNSDLEPLAEAWVLSCHPDGESIIAEGEHQGQRLSGYAAQYGANFWGTKCEEFDGLPLLIKLIDAKTNLSIQVHPDNAYALEHEHQYGKTEMWYVVEAAPDAYLYYGLKKSVTKSELSKSITDGTIIDLLRAVPVHAGDLFFIPAGTIHAICGGTVIAEIQQNSNVTYRVFDYNRVGKDGKCCTSESQESFNSAEYSAFIDSFVRIRSFMVVYSSHIASSKKHRRHWLSVLFCCKNAINVVGQTLPHTLTHLPKCAERVKEHRRESCFLPMLRLCPSWPAC